MLKITKSMNRRRFNFFFLSMFLSLIILPRNNQKKISSKNVLVSNWNLKSEDILDD